MDLAFAADGGVTKARAFGGTDRLQACVVRSLAAVRPAGLAGGLHLVTVKLVVPPRVRRPAPRTGAPESPVAMDLCGSLHGIAARRKARCCHGTVAGDADAEARGPVRAACVQLLSDMLADGTVAVDADKAQACRKETAARYERCDAIGVNERLPPASCLDAVSGKVALGGACRSTLECRDGLLCEGNALLFGEAARGELGRCARPAPDGEPCLVSADSLSTAVRPAPNNLIAGCAQQCTTEHRGAPFVGTGATCLISDSCGKGAACVGARRVATLPGRGERCDDACAAGLRCVGRVCVEPRGTGEACAVDGECVAGCVGGRCGERCEADPGAPPL